MEERGVSEQPAQNCAGESDGVVSNADAEGHRTLGQLSLSSGRSTLDYERMEAVARDRIEIMRQEGDLRQVKALKLVIEASRLARELKTKEKTEKTRSLKLNTTAKGPKAAHSNASGGVSTVVDAFMQEDRVATTISDYQSRDGQSRGSRWRDPNDVFAHAMDDLGTDNYGEDLADFQSPMSPATASSAFASTPKSSPQRSPVKLVNPDAESQRETKPDAESQRESKPSGGGLEP